MQLWRSHQLLLAYIYSPVALQSKFIIYASCEGEGPATARSAEAVYSPHTLYLTHPPLHQQTHNILSYISASYICWCCKYHARNKKTWTLHFLQLFALSNLSSNKVNVNCTSNQSIPSYLQCIFFCYLSSSLPICNTRLINCKNALL